MIDGFPFFADAFANDGEEKKDSDDPPRFSLRSRSFDENDGFLIPFPTDPRETTDGRELRRRRDDVGGGELHPWWRGGAAETEQLSREEIISSTRVERQRSWESVVCRRARIWRWKRTQVRGLTEGVRKEVLVGDVGDGGSWGESPVGGCLSAMERVEREVERLRLNSVSSSSSGDRGGVPYEPKKSGVVDSGAMAGEMRAGLRTADTGASNEKFSNIVAVVCMKERSAVLLFLSSLVTISSACDCVMLYVTL